MKMHNKLFKTCLTGIVLSVAGLANAEETAGPVTIFTEQLMSHAVISGGALNIAADSVVDSNLAAQAAVTIGAGLNTQTQNIYAGAAVTTGALSTVKNIFSGAAAGIGAGAHAQNVHAGAAITVGAGGDVQEVYAGAAITLGAGADTNGVLAANANTFNVPPEDIRNATSMAAAIAQIGVAQDALTTLNDTLVHDTYSLNTTMGGLESLEPGIHQGSALSIAANSEVTFSAINNTNDAMDHVWVINLTEALTVGAGTVFVTDIPSTDTATIIWNVGAAVTLGAGTEFLGTAFVGGAFSAATSNVSCGNIYATGVVSVGSIGAVADGSGVTTLGDPVACVTNAQDLTDFAIGDNEYKWPESLRRAVTDETGLVCPLWGGQSGWEGWVKFTDMNIAMFSFYIWNEGQHLEMRTTAWRARGKFVYVNSESNVALAGTGYILPWDEDTYMVRIGDDYNNHNFDADPYKVTYQRQSDPDFSEVVHESGRAAVIEACTTDYKTLFLID